MMLLKSSEREYRPPIEIVRPSFYGMLIFYYCGMLTYGLSATVFTLPSLAAINGHKYALVWALLVSVFSLAATIGVLISRRLAIGWIELAGTLALVSMLITYGVSLLIRAYTTVGTDVSSFASVWLPIILSVLPTWRMMVMVADGTLVRHRISR